MGKIDRVATTEFTDESKLVWFRGSPSYTISYGEAIRRIEEAEKTIMRFRVQLAAQHFARIKAEDELARLAAHLGDLAAQHSPTASPDPVQAGLKSVAA